MGALVRLRERARLLKGDVVALYLAARDPRTPAIAKVVAILVVAYALSPVDLIPDFIPVLGLLDDLVIVPLGIALVLRLVPRHVMDDARRNAPAALARAKRLGLWGLAFIALLWIGMIVFAVFALRWLFSEAR